MLQLPLAVLSSYQGLFIGAACGAVAAGFWGCMVGAVTGHAWDQWKHFMLYVKSRPQIMPFLSSRTALVLSVVATARALDLTGLKDTALALDILKRRFDIDATTLRYVGKILQTEAPQSSDIPAQLHQLRETCRIDGSLRVHIVLSLLELARGTGTSIDMVSAKAIHKAGLSIGMPEDEWRGVLNGFNVEKPDDNPYAVIGVPENAGLTAVSQAYRDLMRSHHPDTDTQQPNTYARARLAERAARINAAYEKLKKSRA